MVVNTDSYSLGWGNGYTAGIDQGYADGYEGCMVRFEKIIASEDNPTLKLRLLAVWQALRLAGPNQRDPEG